MFALTFLLAAQVASLTASDGLELDVKHLKGQAGAPIVVLFHQAGSSLHEYDTIAPRLNALGYETLAISQRSGGELFGKNATAARYKKKASYLDAKVDLEAALAFAKTTKRPIVIWGSSYSAALVFLLAAEHKEDIAAVLSFSPGEYIKRGKARVSIKAAAQKVAAAKIPVFVATPANEKKRAAPIAKAAGTTLHTPAGSVHGSSMLIANKSKTAEATWPLVLKFLDDNAPK